MTLSLFRAVLFVRPVAVLAGLAMPVAVSASVFLDSYVKAQPVIQRAVEAYGGAEKINGINSVYFRSENDSFT